MFKYFLKVVNGLGWPIWIALGGGALGILGGLGGAIATGSVGDVIFVLAFVAVFFFAFWHFMFGPMAEHERLMDIGIEAEATIVSIAENGSSLQIGGAIPKAGMRIVLDVHARDRAPFRATVNSFVSMFELKRYEPGRTLHVKYDPRNTSKVTIAEGVPSTGMFGSSSRR